MMPALVRAEDDSPVTPHLQEAQQLARAGVLLLALGLAPAAAWMSLAPLSSAVIAPAFVKVDLDRRPVQHVEGGIVREVKVRDGQHVAQGEPLLVLGDVAVDAEVNRLALRVSTERAGLSRLEAEQAHREQLTFPDDLLASARSDPRLAEQLRKEQALFDARRDSVKSQVALLHSQRDRVSQEGTALLAQIERATESLRHQRDELETNRSLRNDGFISATRISQLEATVADYGVKLEERRSELARAQQRLLDIDLRIQGLEGEYRQQASNQLTAATARLADIQQELRKSTDAARRQVLVSPVAGDVVNLKVSTPGALVAPRETVADIVPADPRLVIEAHLRTEDVSRVQQGQAAEIRLTAFNTRTTRLVQAKVFYIAPDRSVDRSTNQPYYVLLMEADPASLRQAGDIRLQAGMPAEVFIEGERRTPLQYLLEPLTDVLRHAARER